MTPKLSKTMRDAIDFARENEGKLIRHPGGFWAKKVLTWAKWFGTTTVEALVARGVGTYTAWEGKSEQYKFPVEFTLTPAAADPQQPGIAPNGSLAGTAGAGGENPVGAAQ